MIVIGVNEHEFWSQVDRSDPNGCWPWIGPCMVSGYGRVRVTAGSKGRQRAHRVALIMTQGLPPPARPFALHSCDNPPCCRPDHLRWGNQADNVSDARRRHRASSPPRGAYFGEWHHWAKLTPQDVRSIREAIERGESQRSIARRFDVSQPTVSEINTGKKWWRW